MKGVKYRLSVTKRESKRGKNLPNIELPFEGYRAFPNKTSLLKIDTNCSYSKK